MSKILNIRQGRILVAVIALAAWGVPLFLAACSEPAPKGTETAPPPPVSLVKPTHTPMPVETGTPAGTAAAPPGTHQGIQRAAAPNQTRIPATPTPLPMEEDAPSSSQASELLNGTTWVLVSLDGRPVIDGTFLFLRVDGNTLEGFDGCNSLWGRHEDGTPFAKADGTFSGLQIGWTDIGCPDPVIDQAERYNKAVIEGKRFRTTQDRLEILDSAGDVRLVFTKQEDLPGHAAGLPGTQWRLVYEGEEAASGNGFTLAFLDDSLAAGTTDCRDFVSEYKTAKERLDFYATSMIGSTEGCPRSSSRREGRFTNDLSHANEYSVEEGQGKNRLHFRTSRGRSLTLEQLPQTIDSIQGVEWQLTAFATSPKDGTVSLARGTKGRRPGNGG